MSVDDTCSKRQRHKLQAKWEKMFEKLKDYKQKNGNCLVPNRYEKDRSLGTWVSTQRRYFKLMMSSNCNRENRNFHRNENRIAMLQNIGFDWVARDPRHTPWETRFRELCEYKERNGNAVVPIGDKENKQLANWVSAQRQAYKAFIEGRVTTITPVKIYQLESLGMVWDVQKRARGKYDVMKDNSLEAWQQSQFFASFLDIQNKETAESDEVTPFKTCVETHHYQSGGKDSGIKNVKGLKNNGALSVPQAKSRMGAKMLKFSLEPQFKNIEKQHDSVGDYPTLLKLSSIEIDNESTSNFTRKRVSCSSPQTEDEHLHKMLKTVQYSKLNPAEPREWGNTRLHHSINILFQGKNTSLACQKGNIPQVSNNHCQGKNVKNIEMKPFPKMTCHSEQESSTPIPLDSLLGDALEAGHALTTHMAVESDEQVHSFLEMMSWRKSINALMALSNENFF